MKKIKYSIGLMLSMLVMFSACTDFVEPRIPYSTFDTGLYLRTLARTSDTFNFFDLASSRFDITIEAVDAEESGSLTEVEVTLRHRRLIPGVGLQFIPDGTATTVNTVSIRTIAASEFVDHPDSKFRRTQIVVTANEAMAALGVTAADIEGGDTFEFYLEATDRFGRKFNRVNASPDVRGGIFYSSPFLYFVGVVCPSDISTPDDNWDATAETRFGTDNAVVKVNRQSGSQINWIVSDVSAGLYERFGFETTQEGIYSDACGVLDWVGAGETQFSLVAPNDGPGSYDPETGRMVIFWRDSGNNIDGETVLIKQ